MKGLPRSRSRGSPQRDNVRRQRIRVSALPITVSGASGVGFGTAVIGGLPEGNILLLGALCYLKFTKNPAASVQDAFDGDFSIGTAPTADATLSGSEVDIIPSTALGAATAGVSPTVRATHAVAVTGTVYDNTDKSLELNLNMLIDDANISAANQVMKVDGYVDIAYAVMGDD
jgi:hypothetical protein